MADTNDFGRDISLNIGPERTLRVHRAVLASFSPYFEALLGDNWEEGKKDEIEILGLDENAVSDLVEFAYSGNININKDNVETLLEAADYLGIEYVKKSCGDFLRDNVDHKTCLGIWQLADVFALEELSKVAKQHALRHFTDVCKDAEFLCLPFNLLVDLLADEELCVVIEDLIPCVEEREKAVLQAVFQYVEHDVENRKDHLPKLLSLVRLPTLSESFLKEVTTHKLVADLHEEIMEKAQNLKLDPPEKDSPDEKWAAPRDFAKYIVVWERSFANGGHLKPEIKHCTDIKTFEDLGNDLYVTGMELWFRQWDGTSVLGALKVYYNGDSPINTPMTFGCDTGGTAQDDWEHHEFHLEENERIAEVEGDYGKMINRLTFYTNKKDADGEERCYGPYGGDSGLAYKFDTHEGSYGFLAGVAGAVVKTKEGARGITRLQFAWRTYILPGDLVPPKNRCRVGNDLENDYDYEDLTDEYYLMNYY